MKIFKKIRNFSCFDKKGIRFNLLFNYSLNKKFCYMTSRTLKLDSSSQNLTDKKYLHKKKKFNTKKSLIIKMEGNDSEFSMHSEFQTKLIQNINSNIHSIYSLEGMNDKVILATYLLGVWSSFMESVKPGQDKRICFIFVDNDEDVNRVIEIGNIIPELNIFYNETNCHLSNILSEFEIINISKNINYLFQKEKFEDLVNFLFYRINNMENLSAFLKKNAVLFNNLYSYTIFSNKNSLLKEYNLIFQTINKSFFSATYPADVKKEINNLSTIYKAMIINYDNCQLVLDRIINKFLNHNIAIIYDNPYFNFIQPHLKNKKVTVIKQETETQQKFDLVIELPFVSEEIFYTRQNYLNNNSDNKTFMISLFKREQLSEFEKVRIYNNFKISVENLLSKSFCLSNIKDENSELINKELFQFLDKTEEKTEEKVKEVIEKFYEDVKINPLLVKRLVTLFLKQNDSKILNSEEENVSLLNGKSGFHTVLLKTDNPKQLEDRYFIVKFIMRTNLVDDIMKMDDYTTRVQDSFDYVIDIPTQKFQEIYKLAKKDNISVKILNKLPPLYFNPYRDAYKNIY